MKLPPLPELPEPHCGKGWTIDEIASDDLFTAKDLRAYAIAYGAAVQEAMARVEGKDDISEKVEWQRGGKKAVLDAYLKLHEGKLGAHWLWCAIMQINAGDSEERVLADFGYRREPAITPGKDVR